jgi:DNA invertase Pin-like site-specific DNA recombinase
VSAKTIAYSYVRFSTPDQAKGDSLRRQTELAAAFCKRRGWRLDDTLTLRDLGVSAFRGDNAMVGNLRVFLDAIAKGTVRPGSALIVESIDRISRQGIDEGYDICKKILKAGVVLVTLSPEREFGADAVKSLSKGALEIQLILERAAEESERKSHRSREAWVSKRRLARAGGVMTHHLPAWVVDRNGTLDLAPEKAAAVRKIFDLAIAGYGITTIMNRLTAAKIRPLTKGGRWARSYVAAILKDRRAVGEYQPRTRKDEPDGDPVANYYPAVVTEDEYTLARAAQQRRRRKPGRVGGHINVFAGLLHNARGGDSYYSTMRNVKGRRYRVLVNHDGREGRCGEVSFPLETFDAAVLGLLREIDVHDILNGDAKPDESVALAAELARVEARIAELERELLRGDVAAGVRALRVLEAQKRDLTDQLTDARHRAAHPLSETWGEAKGLLEALAAAPDPVDARMRLRDCLRALISEAWMLVVPKRERKDRLCALQLLFNTDDPKVQRRRDYVIFHQAGRNNGTPPRWWCGSLALLVKPGDFDLRDRDDAAGLGEELAELDPAEAERTLRRHGALHSRPLPS